MTADPHHEPAPEGTEAERAMVYDYLARREKIAEETKAQIAAQHELAAVNPLEAVDEDVRRQVEDAFYAERGKERYVTRDGRVLFLSPNEIAHRMKIREHGGKDGRGKVRKRSRYYGVTDAERGRWWLNWGFNIGIVVVALLLAWVLTS